MLAIPSTFRLLLTFFSSNWRLQLLENLVLHLSSSFSRISRQIKVTNFAFKSFFFWPQFVDRLSGLWKIGLTVKLKYSRISINSLSREHFPVKSMASIILSFWSRSSCQIQAIQYVTYSPESGHVFSWNSVGFVSFQSSAFEFILVWVKSTFSLFTSRLSNLLSLSKISISCNVKSKPKFQKNTNKTETEID